MTVCLCMQCCQGTSDLAFAGHSLPLTTSCMTGMVSFNHTCFSWTRPLNTSPRSSSPQFLTAVQRRTSETTIQPCTSIWETLTPRASRKPLTCWEQGEGHVIYDVITVSVRTSCIRRLQYLLKHLSGIFSTILTKKETTFWQDALLVRFPVSFDENFLIFANQIKEDRLYCKQLYICTCIFPLFTIYQCLEIFCLQSKQNGKLPFRWEEKLKFVFFLKRLFFTYMYHLYVENIIAL